MKTLNVHEAKTNFSKVLALIEKQGSHFVICRNGKPVADLVPHRTKVSMDRHAELGRLKIKYDPVEELTAEEWPSES